MAATKPILISPVGLHDYDVGLLSSVVERLRDHGIHCHVLPGSNPRGHLAVVDTDSEEGKNTLPLLRPGQVKLLLSQEPTFGKNLVSVPKPLREDTLTPLLMKVCERMQTQMSARPGATGEEPRSVDTRTTAPAHASAKNLLHLLLWAKRNKESLKIIADPHPPVFINGSTSAMATAADRDQQKAISRTRLSDISVEHISNDAFPGPADGTPISSLSGFLWSTALACSKGELLGEIDRHKAFKLKAWPNFTRNDFVLQHLELAAILARRAVSIDELQKITQVPVEVIIDFVNAAYAVNLLDMHAVVAEEEEVIRKQDQQRRNLLSRLMLRLGIK
ncbi:MAG TPA: hypothetical protein ENJ19_12355 [Gammaproteobacteria bacterium]|nr:hypothetical protein [Gammaproteobacteria bacterium]